MRICFVYQYLHDHPTGDTSRHVLAAGAALRQAGHEVWFLTRDPGPEFRAQRANQPGFERTIFVGDGVPESAKKRLFHGGPYYEYSMRVHQTLQALDLDFDSIEFVDHGAEALICLKEQHLFASYASTRIAVTMHGGTALKFALNKQQHRMGLTDHEAADLEAEAIRSAEHLNCPSSSLSEEILSRLGLTDRRARITPTPLVYPTPPPASPPAKRDLSELRYLFFGEISPDQGVEELLSAFAQMPDLQLEVCGRDTDRSPSGRSYLDLLRLRRAPHNVEFTDYSDEDARRDCLARADVCIFPARFAGYPLNCLDAMAAAKIVIGSHHGGMAEMIEHGVHGFLFDGRNPTRLVETIQGPVQDALTRLPEMAEAAAIRARELSDPSRFAANHADSWSGGRPPQQLAPDSAPRVSVIIPFFRDRSTIDEAVDSAIHQSHENLQILLVSDGSPLEDADEILDRQQAKDPRLTVLRKRNGGLGSARNHALDHADGEFVLFLDADNILLPEYAELGINALRRSPDRAFAIGHLEFFDQNSGDIYGLCNGVPFNRATALLMNRFGDAGAFFRRSTFVDHGIRYDESLIAYEDWALWMKLNQLGLRGEFIPREVYRYRVRTDSMMAECGLPHHPALLGWLIHHHLPQLSDDETRALLTTLFQVAGRSIQRIMFGEMEDGVIATPSADTEPSTDTAPRTDTGPRADTYKPLRYKMVDKLSRISTKIPGLNRALRALLGAAARLR